MQAMGFEEIISHQVETGIDWDAILHDGQCLSLFSSGKCHIIRFSGNKPGQPGARFINQITQDTPDDTIFILVMAKLDKASMNSAWYKKIKQSGECCEIKPVYANELASWIGQRATSKNLQLDQQAAFYLADLTEGNLLASDQELEKLALVFDPGSIIDLEMIRENISRSARYNHFLLADACLAGQAERAMKILRGLEQEGIQPIQILYAMQNILQVLLRLKVDKKKNGLNEALWRSLQVWKNKQRLYSQALSRLTCQQIERFLQSCATLDRINKGRYLAQYAEADWQLLRQLVGALTGIKTAQF